jgi:hypothetical protein
VSSKQAGNVIGSVVDTAGNVYVSAILQNLPGGYFESWQCQGALHLPAGSEIVVTYVAGALYNMQAAVSISGILGPDLYGAGASGVIGTPAEAWWADPNAPASPYELVLGYVVAEFDSFVLDGAVSPWVLAADITAGGGGIVGRLSVYWQQMPREVAPSITATYQGYLNEPNGWGLNTQSFFPVFVPKTPPPITPPVIPPVTVQKIIPSYLYWEYADDDDLQAFVASYNAIAQQFLDTFNDLNLPVYTDIYPGQSPPNLLDWVATGLYGYPRPVLPSGLHRDLGPYDTVPFDFLPFNTRRVGSVGTFYVTNDDIYKRCLTWHFFKGDGRYLNTRWLKRRLVRFLYGVDGVNVDTSNTDQVSVTFVGGGVVDIHLPETPVSATLKAAIDAGVLELPFQNTFNVSIS